MQFFLPSSITPLSPRRQGRNSSMHRHFMFVVRVQIHKVRKSSPGQDCKNKHATSRWKRFSPRGVCLSYVEVVLFLFVFESKKRERKNHFCYCGHYVIQDQVRGVRVYNHSLADHKKIRKFIKIILVANKTHFLKLLVRELLNTKIEIKNFALVPDYMYLCP